MEIYILNNNINGKGKEYYENGQLKFEGEYLNGKIKGIRKGKQLNKNDQFKLEGEYSDWRRK